MPALLCLVFSAHIPTPWPAFHLFQREAPPAQLLPLSSLQLPQEASGRAGYILEGVTLRRAYSLPHGEWKDTGEENLGSLI